MMAVQGQDGQHYVVLEVIQLPEGEAGKGENYLFMRPLNNLLFKSIVIQLSCLREKVGTIFICFLMTK